MSLCILLTPAFSVSLELQGDCSDQITLICRHSDIGVAPLWIHNDTTVESGATLDTAFPGAVYTVETLTEHTATITGVDSVRALDGYLIQCAYANLGNLIKSNAVHFSFIPPGQCMCCIQTLFMMYSYEQSMPLHQRLVVYSHALLTELALTDLSFY